MQGFVEKIAVLLFVKRFYLVTALQNRARTLDNGSVSL